MDKVKVVKNLVWILPILLFLLFIGSGLIVGPLYGDVNVIDEGQFGGWITHMLHGQKLYKDTYAAYGPLYIYPYYFLSKLFEPSVFLLRIVYIVINTGLAIIIANIVLRELKVSALIRFFVISLLLIIPGFGMRQASAVFAIYMFYKAMSTGRNTWWFASGLMVASSFLISSDMGIFTAIIFAIILVAKIILSRRTKPILGGVVYMLVGILSIIIPFAAFSYLDGWLFSYIATVVDDYKAYSGIAIPNGQAFPNAINIFKSSTSFLLFGKNILSKEILLYWHYLFYVFVFAYILRTSFSSNLKQERLLFSLIAVFGFFLSLILIGRSGHISFVLPLTWIIGGYIASKLLKVRDRLFAYTLIFLMLVFSLRFISIYRPHFPKILTIPKNVADNKAKASRVGPIAISKGQDNYFIFIQDFINKNTRYDDEVFFFGNEPIMYFIADRVGPTRFNLPEVVNSIDKRYEIIDALERKKTKYIIENLDAWDVDGVSNKVRLPEVYAYIKRNYNFKKFNHVVIYTRR